MHKLIAALAATMVLFGPACQSGPTTTHPIPKPPVLEEFTVDPDTITSATRVTIHIWLSRVDKESLTMRIEENGETILYRTPTSDFGLAYLLSWDYLGGKPSVAIGFSRVLEETTVYTLTFSSPAGGETHTRTVIFQ